MCLCGQNTTVEQSWLHDNYIAHLADPSLAHTGGIFPYGGSGPLEISHNRLEPGVDAATGNEVPDYWQAITAVLFTQSVDGSTLQNYDVHDNFVSLGAYDFYPENGKDMIRATTSSARATGATRRRARRVRTLIGPTTWSATSIGNPTNEVVPQP